MELATGTPPDKVPEVLLNSRQSMTDALAASPYDPIVFLDRAVVHADLGYPDLAAGDAYRALLLTDEVLNPGFEFHDRACAAVSRYTVDAPPPVLQYGLLLQDVRPAGRDDRHNDNDNDDDDDRGALETLAVLVSVRCFQILASSLLLCGCLGSASTFCLRGLAVAPHNRELIAMRTDIAARTDDRTALPAAVALQDQGLVRRELYPWNQHEPDRLTAATVRALNADLAAVAPKCEVRVTTLPALVAPPDAAQTCRQLGLFACEDLGPGEELLREYSLLTAGHRLGDALCDACSTTLPDPSGGDSGGTVCCPACADAAFCSPFCLEQAQQHYHPAVCDRDLDAFGKDPPASETDEAICLLLLARVLALAAQRGLHPLLVREVRHIWGDFSSPVDSTVDSTTVPPPTGLSFSFHYNIQEPIRLLECMGVDIFASLAHHDLWVINTVYAKLRGTASGRRSPRDGRPDVTAVHPLWCLANHDCNPNVSWDWAGSHMVMCARAAGVRAGSEILSHYCDISLPVQQRREWAHGSLGGWCMCQRCQTEAAEAAEVVV